MRRSNQQTEWIDAVDDMKCFRADLDVVDAVAVVVIVVVIADVVDDAVADVYDFQKSQVFWQIWIKP